MTDQERAWFAERDGLLAQLRREQDARAELRVELNRVKAEQETGTVALLRIREHAAKKENERLRTLLTSALDVADTFLLNADKGASTTNLDAMDKLHIVRTEAKRLGVE